MKRGLLLIAAAMLGGMAALTGAHLLGWDRAMQAPAVADIPNNVRLASYEPGANGVAVADFTYASEKSLPAVVHIQSSVKVKEQPLAGGFPFNFQDLPDPFRQFFGEPVPRRQPGRRSEPEEEIEQGVGSGIIISPDGYIVTNNHVVEDASKITVTLNDKQVFDGQVIGTDPSTDLALVKIDAQNLPFIQFANSDEVQVGQWVVAVGNPFNLASTVTAGIVSAKGRDIHIVADQAPIESFIQTDAVVNPGNSGGALVNLNGELIGINTAIASPTGVYAGYAFAIPSNIASKVIDDLRRFGVAQRAYLGIMVRNVDGAFAKEKGLKTNSGVYVDSLTANSAAEMAGIKRGDVIIKIEDNLIQSSPELLESVARHRPGDKMNLTVLRGSSEKPFTVTLKNRAGNTDVVKKTDKEEVLNMLGAEFKALNKQECEKYGIKGGVQVTSLSRGKIANQTDIQEGFIITKVNNHPISTVEELSNALEGYSGGVMIEGIYPKSSEVFFYAFGL